MANTNTKTTAISVKDLKKDLKEELTADLTNKISKHVMKEIGEKLEKLLTKAIQKEVMPKIKELNASVQKALVAGNGKKGNKKPKDAPKNPLTAYMLFSRDKRPQVAEGKTKEDFGLIGKLLGDMWRNASEAERKKYVAEAEKDKARYAAEMEVYNKKQAAAAATPVDTGVAETTETTETTEPVAVAAPKKAAPAKKAATAAKK